jgi:hypothetical protein
MGKSDTRRSLERELEEMVKMREDMNFGRAEVDAGTKRKLTEKIVQQRKKIALQGIKDTYAYLRSKKGIEMRNKIDKEKTSGMYLMRGIVGEEGAFAMFKEAVDAYNKVCKDMLEDQAITASGGSTFYRWIYFKMDPTDKKEKPTKVVKMPNPNVSMIGEENPFPTAGMYSEATKTFCPLPLYTEYLFRIVYLGMATTIQDKHLLYLKCNYLYSYEGMEKADFRDGVLHVDFDIANQEKWKKMGDPATHILCVAGKTPLRFSSVSRKSLEETDRKPRIETEHTCAPGDGVWFSWRQYHATKVPAVDPSVKGSDLIEKNVRLQAMFSPIREDFPEESEEYVFLHGHKRNMDMYDEAEEAIEHNIKKHNIN